MIALVDILKKTESYLRERGVESPRREAELLLGSALEMDRIKLYMQFDRPLSGPELDRLRPMVARRGRREPMAWILGERGFWTLDHLKVHPGVLVPRPDTETLVEKALEWLPAEQELFVADIGCGSGAIGLALAQERPQLKVYAVDRSPEALANTRENVAGLGLSGRVAVLQGDLLEGVPRGRTIDVVVSNPPYIQTEVIEGLEPEVRDWEPRLALDGGADGLEVYRRLLPAAAARARQAVLVEIGHDQGPAVAALFAEAGLREVEVFKDLGGNDRVVRGRPPAWPAHSLAPGGGAP